MSDVTEAPTQDAIADSLLPAEEQLVEQPETEQQVEPEAQEQPPEQPQEQVEEIAEDWIPTEQDKVFPDEVYAKYAETRYGLSPEQAADPQIRQILHDKINSDIFIEQQRQAYEQQIEPEPVQEPTQEQPQLSYEQYFQNLDRMIEQRTDPRVANEMYAGFMRVFGVSEAEIAKLAPTQAMPFVKILSRGALNLVNTFMDDMLGERFTNHLFQAFPGFAEMYERSSYAMAWDRVRNSSPQFAQLPAYGTKDFSKTLRAAAVRIPGFDEMQFTGPDGKALPPMENSMRKYSMLAQIASGQNVNPKLLQQAAAAGARNARRAEVRRSAGQLGSGQSKAGSSTRSSQFQTNDDLFDDETMAMYQKEHGRL